MNQLVLSGQRLSQAKVLQTGTLNVFEALKQHQGLSCVHLEVELPEIELGLNWKESKTPAVAGGFSDLVGKKMTEYKFQYLGQFVVGGQAVNVAVENFASNFPDRPIHQVAVESIGWLNCTWLVDFLMNAKAIDESTIRHETLSLKQENGGYRLSLSNKGYNGKHVEQQHLLFDGDFKTVAWDHVVLFSGN